MELQKLTKLIRLLDELVEYGEFDQIGVDFDIEGLTDALVKIAEEKERAL